MRHLNKSMLMWANPHSVPKQRRYDHEEGDDYEGDEGDAQGDEEGPRQGGGEGQWQEDGGCHEEGEEGHLRAEEAQRCPCRDLWRQDPASYRGYEADLGVHQEEQAQ